MALIGAIRCLAALPKSEVMGAAAVVQSRLWGASAGYATGSQLSKKDVAYLLDSRDDPEVDAAVKEYMQVQFVGGKAASTVPEEHFALASKVEKKYVAAQIVAQGVQNIALPLTYDGKDTAPVKRFASQLVKLGMKAGFEDPATEVEKRLAEKAKTAETVKDFLGRIQPYTSTDFASALSEALQQVEAETNSTVTMDTSSQGYQKFAEKVKAVATAHNIPWKLLVDAKKPSGDADANDVVRKGYQAWAQSARLADALAEVEVLKAEAAALLDKHLAKTAEQVRKEQESSLASLQRRIEAAKGAKWAVQFQEDLKNVAWFDASVAANPAVGPRATA